MRINELLEGKDVKELEFVKKDLDGTKIDFDLVEDLTFFMNHDDDMYRRHVYPLITKCIRRIKAKEKIDPMMFKPAVKECYKQYMEEYPIKELPETLEDKTCKAVCKKMLEDFKKHHNDGKYKDN